MKLLYIYINVPTEGSEIHIRSFVEAFRSLGECLEAHGEEEDAYAGGKESWSMWRRLRVRVAWFSANARHAMQVWRAARVHGSEVLLFRFDPLHRLALAIVLLSAVYPVVLEINAVRSIENDEGRPRPSDWLDGLLMKRAKRMFVVSERLKDHLMCHYGVSGQKVSIIENGVDTEKFHPEVSGRGVRNRYGLTDRFVIAFVGSFRPWHGVQHLLAVAKELIPELPRATFLLVGDGPERSVFERTAAASGLAGHTVFTGHVPHASVPQYLAAADVLMYPMPIASFQNGFYGSALKLFEYMAMGRPVITSGLGQNSVLFEHGISGMLIPAEDTGGLKAAILQLSASAELRASIGRAARNRVLADFTWRTNAEKVRALCAAALTETKGR